MANSSSDLSSFLPENELVELLWENGQIMMQGQSNRAKKNFSGGSESGFSGRIEGKSYGDDANVVKFGMNGAMDSPAAAHDLPPAVPCSLNSHEEDADQWLSYAVDDGSFQSDYCSEFFSTVMTSLSNSNGNLNTADKNTSFGPAASEPGKNRVGYLFSVPQQSQILSDNPKSKPLEIQSDTDRNIRRFQKQDAGVQKPLHKSGGSGLINFSHFSRHASLAKSNPHGIGRLHEKSCAAERTCAESTLIDSVSISKPSSSSQCQNSSFAASMSMEMNESDRATETLVASCSVSGHGAGVTSNGIIHKSKKRTREGEESGEQSDDLEEESFGVKEPSSEKRVSGKRSRAAEVHNLSERRRRDRINEKMRALQELIPNCNKVDKASMLDEAIEYLKTLQLQVQMMSMGSGLCMTPMMLPAGMNMQHLRAPQMSPFSPLGVGMGIGMGMGLGFGMGMIDLNGSPGLIPVPPMQFPCPSVPGVAGIYRMPSSSSPIHSLGIPAQRLPVSIPNSPFLHSQTGLSSQRGSMSPLQVSETGPSGSQNQQHQCLSLETKGKASQAVGHNDGLESGASRNIDRKPNC